MLVIAVLTLYTSNPASSEMRALVDRLKATGRLVFLKPLAEMPLKKKPSPPQVAHVLQGALAELCLN